MQSRAALLLAFAFVASSVLAVPTHAQTATPATEFATHMGDDQPNDVNVCENGTCQAAPQGRFAPADLIGLDVGETSEAFTVTLKVSALQPQPAAVPLAEAASYRIYFKHFDRSFRLNLNQQFDNSYTAQLQAYDPARHAYFTITSTNAPLDLTVKADDTANTLAVTILHRDLLADSNGSSPHPEVPLTGWHVTSASIPNLLSNTGRGGPTGGQKLPAPSATDSMPDNGNFTTDLTVHLGVQQTGHARLKAPIPSRASNGEATTFVFAVDAYNTGKTEDQFDLSTTQPPTGWEVKLPAQQITIPGNGTLHLVVLVTTPFAHQHGAFLSFVVEMHSVSDPSTVGRVQLGVRFTNPPQPAGHHPQMWIHSSAGAPGDQVGSALATASPGNTPYDNEAYMDAEDQDPNDAKVNVPGDLTCDEVASAQLGCGVQGLTVGTGGAGNPVTAHYLWTIPLAPALDMGLDFDMAGKGSNLNAPPQLTAHFANVLPMRGTTLTGRLVYYPPAPTSSFSDPFVNGTVVATMDTTAPVDINPQTTDTGFTTPIHPAPGGDYIPFKKGASLVLYLYLNFTRVDALFGPHDAPTLIPGGTFTLPLVEYHDPVTDILVSTVELVATSKPDRFVNPGKSVLFNVTLINHGDQDTTFLVEVSGTHAPTAAEPWTKLLIPDPHIRVPAGGSQKFAIAVDAPSSAARPDAADLVVTATSEKDFAQRSLLHLYAVIDTDHDWPGDDVAAAEGAFAPPAAKTPGFEMVALVAALAVVAVALRRRKA